MNWKYPQKWTHLKKERKMNSLAKSAAFNFRIMDKLEGVNETTELHPGEQTVQRRDLAKDKNEIKANDINIT